MVKKRLLFIAIFAFVILITTVAHADVSGKVVGIADGDTITVLENRTQYKIRLFGVDCPEKSQDFGIRAKQFTSDLVFGKTVQVIPEETDRYVLWTHRQGQKFSNLRCARFWCSSILPWWRRASRKNFSARMGSISSSER